MTDQLTTIDWRDAWMQQQWASGSTGYQTNPQSFEIQQAAQGNDYNSYGTMSVLKQTKDGETSLWWGYSTQVNYKTYKLTSGFYMVQFLVLEGSDLLNSSNKLNFRCNWQEGPLNTADQLNSSNYVASSDTAAASWFSKNCGSNDLTLTVSTAAYQNQLVGSTSPITDCPNNQQDKSNFHMYQQKN